MAISSIADLDAGKASVAVAGVGSEQAVVPDEMGTRSRHQPVTVTGAERGADRPPPHVGQDSVEVLTEMGLSPERIAALRADGVIGAA